MPADLRAVGLTDAERRRILGDETVPASAAPAIHFPAVIVVAEVGSNGPCLPGPQQSGPLAMHLITRDDFPRDEHLARLRALPEILAAKTLDPRGISRGAVTAESLRAAARAQRADLLLVYTFATFAELNDKAELASLATLGLAPTTVAKGRTVVEAVLIDARTGYLYGLARAEDDAAQLANLYTADEAEEDARSRAERRAFERLLADFPNAWQRLVSEYR